MAQPCNFTSGIRQPHPHRHGNAPAEILRAGSAHAPMWTAICLDCDARMMWRRLLSAVLADLAWHQEMHRVWRAELQTREHAA